MGVTRKVIKQGTKQGTGAENPKRGDMVTIEYTGYFYDEEVGPEKDYRGKQYVYYTSRVNVSERKPADQLPLYV